MIAARAAALSRNAVGAIRAGFSRPSPHAVLVATMIVACASLIGLDAWRTGQARLAIIRQDRIETGNLTASLARHAHDTLLQAETLLVGLRTSLEGRPWTTEQLAMAQELVAGETAALPFVHDITAFDSAGTPIVSSEAARSRDVNGADRAFFTFHRAHPGRETHIGHPLRSTADGEWILPVSRRLDDPAGNFAGVVVSGIRIQALAEYYRTFRVGASGMLGAFTTDGIVVAREPSEPAQPGHDMSGAPLFNTWLPRSASDNWEIVSPLNGVRYLGSYRTVEDYPIVVVVGHGFDEVLASWRSDALLHMAISLGTALVVALLGGRFAQQTRRRAAAEAAVRSSEGLYRLLADNSTDVIIQLAADFRRVYVSPASERVLGYLPQELIGRHPRELAHPDDWPDLADALERVAEAGGSAQIAYRARRRDGGYVWVEALGRKLPDDRGMLVVMRDIEERRKNEDKLRQAQRMEAMGQLTAGVAHDFNNMLQGQIGALELLLDEVGGQAKATQFATMALSAAEHGAKLTHSLLAFSRQQVLRPEPVPLQALLNQLQVMLARTLDPRVVLEVDVEQDVRAPFADAAQLEAALLNLALNARDAMRHGGTLSIQACNATTALDRPAGITAHGYVLVAVSDDGVGMAPEVAAQACEPFFTTKPVGAGTGLGLSMVQGFVNQSGGTIRIRSAPRQGTRVELWLPAVPDAAAQDTAAPAPASRGKGRVLLVDDEPLVLEVMAEMLERAGFDVLRADGGEQALALLESGHAIEVLVTDFAMPGLDGATLVRLARAARPEVLAIILTGFAEPERLAAMPEDADVLRKPVRSHELVRAVCDLAQRGAALRMHGRVAS